MSTPRVSVIVPSYHGSATLGRCLDCLEVSLGPLEAELIVVDSSADDASAQLVRARPRVQLIRSQTRLSAGAARNLGARRSRGEVLVFVDQDCLVAPDWIERLLALLDATGADGLGGSIANAELLNLPGSVLYFLEFLYHLPTRRPPRDDAPFLLGCNVAFRREVFERVRYADRTMAEDVLFSVQARQQGLRLVYAPALSVAHLNKRGWRRVGAYLRQLGRASAAAHAVTGWHRAGLVLAHPALVFLAPLYVLPGLLLRVLATARPSYLLGFVLLSPLCLVGNLVWAAGFRAEARALSAGSQA